MGKNIKISGLVVSLCLCMQISSCMPGTHKDTKLSTMDTTDNKYEGKVMAPEFPEYADWLNTRESYKLSDFRGKVVLLDFWTYCCINCMHILPDLKKLEQKYPELVVVGVHSAKFKGEQSTQNIKEAIMRYDIEHPVINDYKFETWRKYGIQAWPTLVLIDPAGKVVGSISGEGNYEVLDNYIEGILKRFEPKGLVKKERIDFKLEKFSRSNSILSFPSKLEADAVGNRLFISDSNNDRILISDAEGNILDVIGKGMPGKADGSFEEAQFFRPQGLAYSAAKDKLYVADTENHLIREIDMKERKVRTVLGTGKQAAYRSGGGTGTQVAINSPWDLALEGDELRIAMAGPHQLWTMNTNTYRADVYAGSGREDIIDGGLTEAALAQPSGITLGKDALYFADSETSSIRKVQGNKVQTIIGQGLFEFGDKDGTYPSARLQHALGVYFHEGKLYVADTYNNKIKLVDPDAKSVRTLIGTGESGSKDGAVMEASLNEPNDITWLKGKFYITDTNNDLVRVYDPEKKSLATLEFKGLEKLTAKKGQEDFSGKTLSFAPQKIGDKTGDLHFRLKFPEGYKFNADAPNALEVHSENGDVVQVKGVELDSKNFSADIKLQAKPGTASLDFYTTVYYCEEKHGAKCFFEEIKFVQPLQVVEGTASPKLEYNLADVLNKE